jgi:hypothetical protein
MTKADRLRVSRPSQKGKARATLRRLSSTISQQINYKQKNISIMLEKKVNMKVKLALRWVALMFLYI